MAFPRFRCALVPGCKGLLDNAPLGCCRLLTLSALMLLLRAGCVSAAEQTSDDSRPTATANNHDVTEKAKLRQMIVQGETLRTEGKTEEAVALLQRARDGLVKLL